MDSGEDSVLSKCCVYLWQRIDGDANLHQAVLAKLKGLGARVAARLSKDVTHIIFQRKLQATLAERTAEDADLRSIYDKVAKVEPPVFVVSLQWLQTSADKGSKAPESRYLIRRPAEPIFLMSSPGHQAAAKRKRKSLAARPRELVEPADVDDAIFSSSQQIRDLNSDEGPGHEAGPSWGGAIGGSGYTARAAAHGARGATDRSLASIQESKDDEEDAGPPSKVPNLGGLWLRPAARPVAPATAAGPKAKAAPGSAPAKTGGRAPAKPKQQAVPVSKGGFKQLSLSFVPVGKGPQQQAEQAQGTASIPSERPGPGGAGAGSSHAGHGAGSAAAPRVVGGSATSAHGALPTSKPGAAHSAHDEGAGELRARGGAAGHTGGDASQLRSPVGKAPPASARKQPPGSNRKRAAQAATEGGAEQQEAAEAAAGGLKGMDRVGGSEYGPAAGRGCAEPLVLRSVQPDRQPRSAFKVTFAANPLFEDGPAQQSRPSSAEAQGRDLEVEGLGGTAAVAAAVTARAGGPQKAHEALGVSCPGQGEDPRSARLGRRRSSAAAELPGKLESAGPAVVKSTHKQPPQPGPAQPKAVNEQPQGVAATAAPQAPAAGGGTAAPAPLPPTTGAAGRRSAQRRGSKSCGGTPLAGGVVRTLLTPQGTPLGNLRGAGAGLTPGSVVLVPRLKSQGSGKSGSATPELVPPGANGPPATANVLASAAAVLQAAAAVEVAPGAAIEVVGAVAAPPCTGGPDTVGHRRSRRGADAAQAGSSKDEEQAAAEARVAEGAVVEGGPGPTTAPKTTRKGRRAGLPPTPPPAAVLPPPSPAPSFGFHVGTNAHEQAGPASVNRAGKQQEQQPRNGLSQGGQQGGVREYSVGADRLPLASASLAAPGGTPQLAGAASARRRAASRQVQEAGPEAGEGAEPAAPMTEGRRRSARLAQLSPLILPSAAKATCRGGEQGDTPVLLWQGLRQEQQQQEEEAEEPQRLLPLCFGEREHGDAAAGEDTAGEDGLLRNRGRMPLAALQAPALLPAASPAMATRARLRAASAAPSPATGLLLSSHAIATNAQPLVTADCAAADRQQPPPESSRKRQKPNAGAAPSPAGAAAGAAAAACSTALHLQPGTSANVHVGRNDEAEALELQGRRAGAREARGTPEASTRRRSGDGGEAEAAPGAGGCQPRGTPLTSPKYHTRFQRHRFSGLGVDLAGVPPGEPFVLQPDGRVELAAGAEQAGVPSGAEGPEEGNGEVEAPRSTRRPGSVPRSRCRALDFGPEALHNKWARADADGPSTHAILPFQLPNGGAATVEPRWPPQAPPSTMGATAATTGPQLAVPVPSSSHTLAGPHGGAQSERSGRSCGGRSPYGLRTRGAGSHSGLGAHGGDTGTAGGTARAAAGGRARLDPLPEDEEVDAADTAAPTAEPQLQGVSHAQALQRRRRSSKPQGSVPASKTPAGVVAQAAATAAGGAASCGSRGVPGSTQAMPFSLGTARGDVSSARKPLRLNSSKKAAPPSAGRKAAAAGTASGKAETPGLLLANKRRVAATDLGGGVAPAGSCQGDGAGAADLPTASGVRPAADGTEPEPSSSRLSMRRGQVPAAGGRVGAGTRQQGSTAAGASAGAGVDESNAQAAARTCSAVSALAHSESRTQEQQRQPQHTEAAGAVVQERQTSNRAAAVGGAATGGGATGRKRQLAGVLAEGQRPGAADTGTAAGHPAKKPRLRATPAKAAAAGASATRAASAGPKASAPSASGSQCILSTVAEVPSKQQRKATVASGLHGLSGAASFPQGPITTGSVILGVARDAQTAAHQPPHARASQPSHSATTSVSAGGARAREGGRAAGARSGGGGGAAARWLAHTCVDSATAAAMQAAVKQLGGAKLCPAGHEEGRVTHLVLGGPAAHPSAPRRTVKVLLGIAAGAHLLQPAWVTDSLAAGRWLPEAPYRAQVSFADRADQVRALLQQEGESNDNQKQQQQQQQSNGPGQEPPAAGAPAPPTAGAMVARPLAGWHVAVHNPVASGPRLQEAQARKLDMERLVVALGGRVVPVRSAPLLLLVGSSTSTTAQAGGHGAGGGGPTAGAGGHAPRAAAKHGAVGTLDKRPAGSRVAGEDWLMDLAETHVWVDPPAAGGGAAAAGGEAGKEAAAI